MNAAQGWRDSSADRAAARRNGGKYRMDNGEVDRGRAAVTDAPLTDIEAGQLPAISIEDIGAHDIRSTKIWSIHSCWSAVPWIG